MAVLGEDTQENGTLWLVSEADLDRRDDGSDPHTFQSLLVAAHKGYCNHHCTFMFCRSQSSLILKRFTVLTHKEW